MSIDTGFAEHLKKKGTTFWSAQEYSQWQALKEKAYAVVSSISAVQFGLIPSHNTPLTFITHQFLHVNLIHLIGTLLFLLLLGIPIERALGTGRTFIIYLISGISGGLVYSLAIRLGDIANHFTPYMGASGAIAGLMGMYIAVFKLQRIRFIYFFITIGLTTAPALILLPIWFCYEVFQVFYVEIEFRELWAHAGGFIAGATAVLISNKFLPIEEELDTTDTKDNHSEYKRELAKVMDCIGNMEFSTANDTLRQLIARNTRDLSLLIQLYKLEKINTKNPSYQKTVEDIFRFPTNNTAQLDQVKDIYREYKKIGSQLPPFEDQASAALILKLCRLNLTEDAEKEISVLLKQSHQNRETSLAHIQKAVNALATCLEKQNKKSKADYYRELAIKN